MRKFQGEKLVVATHNEGKLDEVRALLTNRSVEILSSKSLDLPEPIETEDTFIGNARIKAHSASKITNLPSLADDSGITIDALNGEPGVYTADWAETPSGRDFSLAMKKNS
jgi:XTP/dITP diphosphohydrolase